MSWCDKLASTPTAGIKLSAYVASGDKLFDALSPILNEFVINDRLAIDIERHDTTSIAFNTDIGLRYGIDPSSISISFNHRLRATPTSGGLPELQMISQPSPYTTLLPDVLERLVEATMLLPNISKRKINRVGVVSLTSVSESDLPPGVRKFIEYFSRPWDKAPDHYSFNISAKVGEGDGWIDTCIHNITKTDDPLALMTLNFDFGRKYTNGRASSKAGLESVTEEVRKASLIYFEELAEGNRFDERLISTKD